MLSFSADSSEHFSSNFSIYRNQYSSYILRPMKLDQLSVSHHCLHAFVKVPDYMVISTAWNFKIPIKISLYDFLYDFFSFFFKISAYFNGFQL